jgi:hypothetical protein
MYMSQEQKKTSLLSYENFTPPQNAAIERLYEGNTLLIAQVGFGKAAVGQTVAQELVDDGVLKRVLLIAPLKVCQLTLADEWKSWSHLRKPVMAIGDAGIRELAIDSGAPLVVMNLENLVWFFEKYGDRHGFDGLLVDEISRLKAVGGATMKSLRNRLKDFSWRAGMSATPLAESGIDIYSQALVIDKGKALGRNKDKFMRKYFYPTDFEQRKWALLPGFGPQLAERLKDIVYVAEDQDYEASLPELRDEIVQVEMPDATWKVYDELCGQSFANEYDVEAPNQGVVSSKLQQLASGAIYLSDKAATTVWFHWEKFLALDRLLRGAEGPVAVAYNFEFEKEELRVRYPDIKFLGDDPEAVLEQWNAGKLAILGLHPKSASHGVNAQFGGHELICLSVPWGSDPWQQLIGRFRRRGQKSKYVRRTVIVARGTIDTVVLERHIGKVDDESFLMAHITEHARRD